MASKLTTVFSFLKNYDLYFYIHLFLFFQNHIESKLVHSGSKEAPYDTKDLRIWKRQHGQ